MGRFFLDAPAATNPAFFLPVEDALFLSFVVLLPGEGDRITTCEFEPADESSSASLSDSCGEMKRAVGRGPVVEGPLDFLRIGCGMTTGLLEEEFVLGPLRLGLGGCMVVELTASRAFLLS
jgi:hypothetical protein